MPQQRAGRRMRRERAATWAEGELEGEEEQREQPPRQHRQRRQHSQRRHEHKFFGHEHDGQNDVCNDVIVEQQYFFFSGDN